MSRKLIRQAIVSKLKEKVPAVNQRVFDSLKTPVWEQEEFPCLNVLTPEEDPMNRMQQSAQRTYERELRFVVEVGVKDSEDSEAALDDLCESVENALNSDPTIGGVCYDVEYKGYVSAAIDTGRTKFGVAELKFTATYVK